MSIKYIKSEDCFVHQQEEDENLGHYLISQAQGRILQVNATIVDFVKFLETARSKEELINSMGEELDAEERIQIEEFLKTLYKLGVIRKESDPPMTKLEFLFSVGDTIDGYKVVKAISVRRWTQLYKVQEIESGNWFVLKLFNYSQEEQSTPLDNTMRNRFREEFEIMAKLQHPNICAFHDFHQNSFSYGVVTYIDGLELEIHIQALKTLLAVEALILQILQAFAYLHQQQILHGDIHHHNILVDQNQQIKIIDFGFSYQERENITATSLHAGLAHFIPPERVADHTYHTSKKRGDFRSEVFQLGVLIYYMLTKTFPFKGELWEDLGHAIQTQEITTILSAYPGSLSEARQTLLLQSLSKAPEDRFPNATALLEAWQAAQ